MLIYLCLRLSLLCDAVCHKGNSPSQLAGLGVREELVKSGQLATKAQLPMMITSEVWSENRPIGTNMCVNLIPEREPEHSFDADVVVNYQFIGLVLYFS